MKKTASSLLILFLPFLLFAQPSFKKDYDFSFPSTFETLNQVVSLDNGDLVFCGLTGLNSDNYDMMLMKTDGDGNEIWTKSYSHFKDNDVVELLQAPDGGYLLGGNGLTHFISRVDHSFLIKTNANGEEEWFLPYPDWELITVDVLANGNFLMGIYQDDVLKAIIVDAAGNIISDITIDFGIQSGALSSTSDGGFFAFVNDFGPILIKYDSNQEIEWISSYEYNNLPIEIIEVIDYNYSGGYAVLGRIDFSTNVLTYISSGGFLESQVLVADNFSLFNTQTTNLFELDDGFLFINGNEGIELIGNDGISAGLSLIDEFDLTNQFVFDATPAPDGNFVLPGQYTNDDLGLDGFMIKVSPTMELLFNRFIGDQEPSDVQTARAVAATPDGGFIITGDAYYAGKKGDYTVVKTDADGNVLWEATYGGVANEQCYSVVNTSDGGYLLCGGILGDEASGTPPQLLVMKIDDSGNVVWQRTIENLNSNNFFGTEGIELSDGNLAIAYPGQGSFFSFLKLTADGDSLWNNNYDSQLRRIRRMRADENGGFTALHFFSTGRGNLVKIDSDGTLLLNQIIDEDYESIGLPYGVEHTSDGGYMLSGTSNVSEGFHIAKLDAFGGIEWLNEYDYENYSTFRPYMTKTADGNYVVITSEFYSEVSPENNSMISLTKIDEQGNEIWTNTLGHDKWLGEFCWDLESRPSGGVVMSGYSIPTNSRDMMLVVTETNGTVKVINLQPMGSLQLYPTPSDEMLFIDFESEYLGKLTISIIDTQGKLIKQYSEDKALNRFRSNKNLSYLPAGNYFVRLEIVGRTIIRSWIKH